MQSHREIAFEGIAQIFDSEIRRRARHLENDRFLAIEDDEDIALLQLADLTSSKIGWDLFAMLHELANIDRSAFRRAISDLGFTVFDR